MFDEYFTNIFGDDEVTGSTPDALRDYYFVTDRQNDHNYFIGRLCDVIQSMSNNPSEDFQIIYGGVVTDSGSGQVDISECVAMSVDANGNRRLVMLPALTNVGLPSGYDDGRQIWVTLKYDFSLAGSTRNHWDGTAYHYQIQDTYLGDTDGDEGGSADDLFTDSDPTGTAIVLGSFTMTGTTFVGLSYSTRSKDLILNTKIKVTWTSAQLIGSGLSISGIDTPALCALNGTDVAFIDETLDELRCYRFNGSTWALVGSGLSISGVVDPALCALNGTDVAFIDSTVEELRCYRFNGSTWALVGSGLSISGIGNNALCSLNETDVVLMNTYYHQFRTYRFNGSTWALVGSGLSIEVIGSPALCALNGTDVAFIDSTVEELRCYRFNGSTWALVGSGLSISGIGSPALCTLNRTDVAFIDSTVEELRCYRFNGSIWALVGSRLSISGIGSPALCALNGTDVAFIDETLESLRCYRFGFSIMGEPYRTA